MGDPVPLISTPVHTHPLAHDGPSSLPSSYTLTTTTTPVRAGTSYQHELLLPSLVQSRTNLSRGVSEHSEAASLSTNTFLSNSIDTVDTGDTDTVGFSSNDEDSSSSSDDDNDGNNSDSSEWDKSTILSGVSLASTYLPRTHKKSNQNVDIKSYLIEFCQEENKSKSTNRFGKMRQNSYISQTSEQSTNDLQYDLYSLFYPYTNLQSLLFSNTHPYIDSDYKNIKKKKNSIWYR